MGKLKYLLIVLFILVFLKGFNQDDTDKSCFDSIAEKIINNRCEDAYSQINGFLLKKKTTFQKIELYYYPPLDNFLNNSIYKNKIFNNILGMYYKEYPCEDSLIANNCIKMYINDQKYRRFKTWYYKNLPEKIDSIKKEWDKADIRNKIIASDYLDKYKVDELSKLGKFCVYSLFMVVQHSPYEIQKKYFPIFNYLVKKEMLSASTLALMEDRILRKEGKLQKYGTQVYCNNITNICIPQPHISIDSMNFYRMKVGLSNICIYWRENFNIDCDSLIQDNK